MRKVKKEDIVIRGVEGWAVGGWTGWVVVVEFPSGCLLLEDKEGGG